MLPLAIIAGTIFGLASLAAPGTPERQPSAPVAFAGSARPSEVRVIDGDTFEHNGVRIRIADIDTPELRGACPSEMTRARAARDRLRELLNQGPFELHRLNRDEDRYGRKLRVVTRNGRSIGDMLVAEGLARTWSGRREPWC